MRRPTSADPDRAGSAGGHPCSIAAYPDGPYLVRGEFELLDEDGHSMGLRRQTIALCRCGRTRRAPFCDGTHKIGSFTTSPSTGSPDDA